MKYRHIFRDSNMRLPSENLLLGNGFGEIDGLSQVNLSYLQSWKPNHRMDVKQVLSGLDDRWMPPVAYSPIKWSSNVVFQMINASPFPGSNHILEVAAEINEPSSMICQATSESTIGQHPAKLAPDTSECLNPSVRVFVGHDIGGSMQLPNTASSEMLVVASGGSHTGQHCLTQIADCGQIVIRMAKLGPASHYFDTFVGSKRKPARVLRTLYL